MRGARFGSRYIDVAESSAELPETACAEVVSAIDLGRTGFVLVFVPDRFDVDRLAAALNEQLSGVPAFGCTTAGQIGGDGYGTDVLMLVAFPRAHFHCASVLLGSLNPISVFEIAEATRRHTAQFRATAGWHRLALLFADGLSNQEDILASTLDAVLPNVPIFGGSAGDGLSFGSTFVLHQGRFLSNVAVLLLIETDLSFVGLHFDHFLPSGTQLVVTRADPERRIVYEINGAPAAQEYARLIDCPVEDLSPQVFAENPMLVLYKSQHYVRAIADVGEDGALVFMAAIDDGLVLTLGHGREMVETLRSGLTPEGPDGQTPDFILGFDCVLRKLEFEHKALADVASDLFRDHRVVGFNTYGEQHGGVHMNQTFVGVAFFEPSGKPGALV